MKTTSLRAVNGTSIPIADLLPQVAVIAQVRATSLGLTRLDRDASRESDINHLATEGIGKVNVLTLPGAKPAVDALKAKQREARVKLFYYSTQWGEDRRLLPNVLINDFIEDVGVTIDEHDKLLADFIVNAPRYIAQAKHNLGKYTVQPPSLEQMQRAFSLSYELSPVPPVNSYGNSSLTREMQAKLQEQYEDDVKSAYRKAQVDAVHKLWKPLGNLIDRMAAYDDRLEAIEGGEDVGKTGTFKSSVLGNITDIGKVFREFNLSGDPAMEAIATRLDAFEQLEHADLVKSEKTRKETAAKAAEVRELIKAWL